LKYPAPYSVEYGSWTVITTAGQNISCWLDVENNGAVGEVNVRIVHSDSGEPSLSEATNGFPVLRPNSNWGKLTLLSNSANDIFYATCLTEGAKAIIQVEENQEKRYSILRKNLGKVHGVIPITIIAEKDDVTNAIKTMWSSTQTRYVRYDSAGVTTIVSTDDGDTYNTGIGIWTVKVSGLDNDYNVIQEVVELNGTTPVTLQNQYLAVNEMNPELSGSDPGEVGTDLEHTAQGDITVNRGSNILALIYSGDVENITRQMVFTVPKDATFKIDNVEISTGTADEIIIRIYAVNPVNGIYVLQHKIFMGGGVYMKSLKNANITLPEKHLLELCAQAKSAAVERDISCLISGDLILNNFADRIKEQRL